MQNIVYKNNCKLNLGCGDNSIDGYINIDKIRLDNVDMVLDLEQFPLPFKDNTIKEVICYHVLEHINNYIQLLEEIHRICVSKALIYVVCPYYKYEGAYRDPTHVRFFTENSFYYFQENVKFSHYSKARFDVLQIELCNNFHTELDTFHRKIIKFVPLKRILNAFLWNIYSEISYKLEVNK